jgi:site-specific recombinase XerD
MEILSALQKFIKDLESKKRSPSTIIAYKKDIEQLAFFMQKQDKTLKDIKEADLQNFVDFLINEKNFTLKTVSRKINSLKTFYKYLSQEGVTKSDPADSIKHPKFENKPARVLSQLEYKALRDTVRGNKRLYTMIELLLQTGIRIGELSRLKLDDVKSKSRTKVLRIKAFASNAERDVELNEIAEKTIDKWLESRPNPDNDKNYMFPTKTGNPVLVRNIRTSINRAFHKVGIEDATVNDIRNTFIVYQLESGMDVERLANTVGHQRITSTEKYLDYVKSRPKKTVKKLQEL